MNREELLNWLHSLTFNYIDPSSDWEDIGYTERPIWINSKGYGFLACDDPSEVYWEGEGVPQEKWAYIRGRLSRGELIFSDIKETSLIELLGEISWESFDLEDNVNECLEGLISLPEKQLNHIYAMNTWNGWHFFATEEEFKRSYERDWCDITWDELPDDELLEWYRRLTDIL